MVVNDNGSKKLYVNGELKDENSSAVEFGQLTSKFAMGGDYRAPQKYHHLQADEVRIYNRALSAAEVKALYEFEKP